MCLSGLGLVLKTGAPGLKIGKSPLSHEAHCVILGQSISLNLTYLTGLLWAWREGEYHVSSSKLLGGNSVHLHSLHLCLIQPYIMIDDCNSVFFFPSTLVLTARAYRRAAWSSCLETFSIWFMGGWIQSCGCYYQCEHPNQRHQHVLVATRPE